jgi:hypothetical protein
MSYMFITRIVMVNLGGFSFHNAITFILCILYVQTYSHEGPPVCPYLYAEIDVVAKRKNKVPEPSSTEDISSHVYAVLEQPSNQVANGIHTCMHWFKLKQ